ncbi:outer membrane protein assembly factor BamA [Desulfothermus naphthae]
MRKVFVFFIVLSVFFTSFGHCKTKTILVLPFGYNGSPKYSYLIEDLPKLIKKELEKRGFSVFPLEDTTALLQEQGITELDSSIVKDLTILAGADFGLYGSFTQIGEGFSIDAMVIDPYELGGTRTISISKNSILELMSALSLLAKQVKEAVFHKMVIKDIRVKGNKVLGSDVVLMRLKATKGSVFDLKTIDEDLKRLYKTGYFDDISVDVQDTAEGKIITFIVKEKPIIGRIKIKGAKNIDKDDILEVMDTKPKGLLNLKVLSSDLEKIRELYKKEGYYNVRISYDVKEISLGRAELILHIQEGNKLYIKKITIKGVKQLDEDDVKDVLALKTRGWFSWLTGSGIFKEELLDRDVAAIEALYANRGFIDVKVGQPQVEFKKHGIYITYTVIEGTRYKIGDIKFQGDLIVPRKELLNLIKLDELKKKDKYFDRSVLRDDSEAIRKFYADYGYAFAEVNVNISRKLEQKKVDVIFDIIKRQLVFINRVEVEGNTKTRENVIRRYLAISDGDKFSAKKIDFSKEMLTKLDYFDEVNIETVPTKKQDELDLKVKVKEKSTGFFSAGAGYSSIDSVFFTGKITERNLFGRGYQLSFQGSFGSSSSYYSLSFWNPNLYDGPLGIGTDLFNTEREYDDYTLSRTGCSLRFGYSVGRFSRIYWNFSTEKYKVYDLDEFVSDEIEDIEGKNWANSVYAALVRDSTNRIFNPTKGSLNKISLEYSGGILGGDDNFIKFEYEFGYHKNVFWKLTFNLHFEMGWLFKNTGDDVPDFERYYLGGLNSVRGYDYRDISCYDSAGNDIGGYKMYFTNWELTFPVKEDIGLIGLVFFDAGNVWDKNEMYDLDLYKSVGFGIRWNSPMGPLRLEYGYPLDDLKDNQGKFEFSVGTFF